MTKKIVTRALMIVGLVAASAASSFSQTTVAVATSRRVSPQAEKLQPVAASTVIMNTQSASLNLSTDQRNRVADMNKEVSALSAERAKLWAEYNAVKARPNLTDEMAATEAAPRMLRIVEINRQLAPMAAKQETQLAAVLSSSQRSQLVKMIATVKSAQ